MSKYKKHIFEETEKKSFTDLLYDFIKGRLSPEEFLELSPSFLVQITPHRNLAKSILEFDVSADIEGLFHLSEEDIYFYDCLFAGGCNVYDYDPWIDYFHDATLSLENLVEQGSDEYFNLLKVMNYINPDYTTYNQTGLNEINSFLINNYENYVDEMISTHLEYLNELSNDIAKEKISKEISDAFDPYGATLDIKNRKFSIPAGELYYFLVMSGEDFRNGLAFRRFTENVGGWTDDPWDYEDYSFKTNPLYKEEMLKLSEELLEEFRKYDSEEDKIALSIVRDYPLKQRLLNHATGQDYYIMDYDPEEELFTLKVSSETSSTTSWGKKINLDMSLKPSDFMPWLQNYKLNLESRNILLSLRKIMTNDSQ